MRLAVDPVSSKPMAHGQPDMTLARPVQLVFNRIVSACVLCLVVVVIVLEHTLLWSLCF